MQNGGREECGCDGEDRMSQIPFAGQRRGQTIFLVYDQAQKIALEERRVLFAFLAEPALDSG